MKRLLLLLALFPVAWSTSAFTCDFAVEELVSARGESERYRAVDTSDRSVLFRHEETPRTSVGKVTDFRAGVKNAGTGPRCLRLVCRLQVPYGTFDFWNGYLNQLDRNRVSGEGITALFPAIAALSAHESTVFGLNPMMCASRVDTDCVREGGTAFLQIAFPVYLTAGRSFTAHLTAATARSRYRWHDVVERWYELFPKAFAVADGVHPGFADREIELFLPKDYWPRHPFAGRKLRLAVPARQVMIAGPDFAKPAVPCATRPPVKAKRVFHPTFEECMTASRIDHTWQSEGAKGTN